MKFLYEWLEQVLKEQYQFVKRLRNTDKNEIVVLEHKTLHKRIIKRIFTGKSEVYQKLLTLKHKNMPEILEVTEFENKTLVLEEYIDGMTLHELLGNGDNFNDLKENQVSEMVCELCDILSFVHSFNIIHRDIKPENIIIEKDTQALKLIDFDSSRDYKKYYPRDTIYLGTPGYAAPEQYGNTATDFRADIYSVGVMMNVMLTGKFPQVQLHHGKLQNIIEKCIQVSPDKRFQTAQELKRSLK